MSFSPHFSSAKNVSQQLKKAGIFPPELGQPNNWLEGAVTQGVITEQEASLAEKAHKATRIAIMVDDFPVEKKVAAR